MRRSDRWRFWRIEGALALCLLLSLLPAFGQSAYPTITLHQRSAAKAYARFDQGPISQSATLLPLRIFLAQTMKQRDALIALSIAQQDVHGESYRRWITPQEYAKQFGADRERMQQIEDWLAGSGMKNIHLSEGRRFITFTATVPDIEAAFQVKLHRYRVRGEEHYANVSEPVLPVAFENLVSTIQGLDDFTPRAPHSISRVASADSVSAAGGMQSLGPGDLATIYDLAPLSTAGVSGAQPTIAVVGTAGASLDDFRAYKEHFGLPANDFQTITVTGGKLTSSPDTVLEAALDLEVAGGIAPTAKLIYVEDQDVFAAAAYVIDHRLGDILSMSYTLCELPGPEDSAYEALAMQAAVEGISWIGASGDSGAAGCDQAGSAAAVSGLAVNLPASLPEVTGVGGTRFTSTSSQYWSSQATVAGTTALSYIPEEGWNGSVDRQPVTASGGGMSQDFFKPGYQSLINDGVAWREVPDIAFEAAETTPAYLIVSGGNTLYVAGTSAATPLFAGITALVNRYLLAQGSMGRPGLGNINPVLYRIAQTAPAAFHDITTGSNKVSCANDSVDCSGGTLGYEAGPGYDRVTGLGSVDAYKLASAWSRADIGTSTITLSAQDTTGNGSATLIAQVNAETNPESGIVVFSATDAAYGNLPGELARVPVNESGVAVARVAGLPDGANIVTSTFEGTTALLGAVSAPVTLYVNQKRAPLAMVALVDVPAEFPAGRYLPLAATVAGTTTSPTGFVDFYLGTNMIGSTPLVAGVAAMLSATLPDAGENALTAHYRGDHTYAPAISAPDALTIAGDEPAQAPTPDFALTVPSAMTIGSGQNGSFSFTVAPLHGFVAAVAFTCTGRISGYACSVPSRITPKAPTSVLVDLQSITTAFLPFGALLLLRPGRRKKNMLAFAITCLGLQTGCGVVTSKPKALDNAGTYPVTISAVSGAIRHSAIVNITIQ